MTIKFERTRVHLISDVFAAVVTLCYSLVTLRFFNTIRESSVPKYQFVTNLCALCSVHVPKLGYCRQFSSNCQPCIVQFCGWFQPPPQALPFSHGWGERETRVTGDESQGTMGRVQTARSAWRSPVVSFPPSFARTSKRDVWVRGRVGSIISFQDRVKCTNYIFTQGRGGKGRS